MVKKVVFTCGLMLLCQAAVAIHQGANDLPYSQPMTHPLDKPINDHYEGKAFYMNLGPTGIRARIDPDAPTHFKVMFVFEDAKSPARGKINIGDVIVGANGKAFQTAHGFHRKQPGARGWQGPPFELAKAIEDSQGKEGKLQLIVWPGGKESDRTSVIIQLKPVGRFSKTYPWNCERSDKLRKDLCAFLIKNGVRGRHHYQIQQLLALWAAGEPKAEPLIKAKARELMAKRYDPDSTGMVTWGWGYTGIFLGEYYNLTRDKDVLPAVRALGECYRLGQDWRAGGFSHRPFPFIQKRIAGGGPKGYGAMAGPGGLAMLAQSTFKANGLPYPQEAYERTHQAYLRTAGGNARASIAYGFAAWTHACIEVEDKTKGLSGQGIGYRCPTGMKDIGKYKITWPTKADHRWKPTDWVQDEAKTNFVYQMGGNWRMVVRNMPLPEPTRAYHTEPNGGGHVAPMGMGAAAHFIGNADNNSWQYLGAHLAAGCAQSPGMLFDGHADATMHGFFSVIGALRADKRYLREYLDYVKTLIILSEPHDGQGLVEQPFGCQRNSTASIARDRTAYTHVAILLLSIPQRRLLITGADAAVGAAPVGPAGGGGADGGVAEGGATESPNNPMGSILREGFVIEHCKKQAQTLRAARTAFAVSLRSLDLYARKDDAKGKEAAIFAKRLREWIATRNKELIEASQTTPAQTWREIEAYMMFVRRLDEETELAKRVAQIKAMPGAKELVTTYEDLEHVAASLARSGHTTRAIETAAKARQRIADRLSTMMATAKLNEAIKAEAQAILDALQPKPAADNE